MRLRKIEIDWGDGRVEFDLRGEGGHVRPVIGLLGPTGSGRTMLMRSVIRLFTNSVNVGIGFDDWAGVDASVEFDLGNVIGTGVIRNGVIVQRLVYSDVKMGEFKLYGGILSYGAERGAFPVSGASLTFAERCMRGVLHDLYKGEIKNSVIWVDDFALGLDDSLAREFLQTLIKKSLEKDNQLIVVADRELLLQGVGPDCIRTLRERSTNLIQRVIKTL